jgi:uncharacterized integral membrane protein
VTHNSRRGAYAMSILTFKDEKSIIIVVVVIVIIIIIIIIIIVIILIITTKVTVKYLRPVYEFQTVLFWLSSSWLSKA